MTVSYLQHRIVSGRSRPSKGVGKGMKDCPNYKYNEFSCFSPENYPFAIKYLSFDFRNSHLSENIIYSPQQLVLPTILYFLYVYLILIFMLVSIQHSCLDL